MFDIGWPAEDAVCFFWPSVMTADSKDLHWKIGSSSYYWCWKLCRYLWIHSSRLIWIWRWKERRQMQPLSYLLIFKTATGKENWLANLIWWPNITFYQRQKIKKILSWRNIRHAMCLLATETFAFISQRLHRVCKIYMYTFFIS